MAKIEKFINAKQKFQTHEAEYQKRIAARMRGEYVEPAEKTVKAGLDVNLSPETVKRIIDLVKVKSSKFQEAIEQTPQGEQLLVRVESKASDTYAPNFYFAQGLNAKQRLRLLGAVHDSLPNAESLIKDFESCNKPKPPLGILWGLRHNMRHGLTEAHRPDIMMLVKDVESDLGFNQQEDKEWITAKDAADIIDITPPNVGRQAGAQGSNYSIVDNGKKGQERRYLKSSVADYAKVHNKRKNLSWDREIAR